MRRPSLYSIIVAFLLILIFCGFFTVLWLLAGSYSFGWDEAVYLTKARSWIEDTPADTFGIYRPIGMASVGWVILQWSDSEKIVRAFGVLFGAAALVFIFLLFAQAVNIWVALSITLLVGTSPLFLSEAPQFFNDVPAAGFLFALLWLILRYYQTAGKSRLIYFAAPIAAFAFYLRYGIILQLGIIALISFLALSKKFWNKEGADIWPFIKTGILFLALVAPHFLYSLAVTESFFGVLSLGSEVAGRKYLGEGLFDYMRWLPSTLAGPLVGGCVILGVIVVLVILFRKKLRKEYEELLWLGGIGILVFFFTGLLVHAEARYVFFPVVLISGAGISGIYFMLSRWLALRDILIGLFIISILYFGVGHYKGVDAFFRERENNLFRNAYTKSYKAIQPNSGEPGCAVWTTQYFPQVSWYSECNVIRVADEAAFKKNFQKYIGKNQYSIAYSELNDVQIQPATAEKYGLTLTEIYNTPDLSESFGFGRVSIYRMEVVR